MTYSPVMSTGLNFHGEDGSEWSNRPDYIELTDAPFNYYFVFRDGSSVYMSYYHSVASHIENGVLSVVGHDSDGQVIKVHFPLDFLRHWADIGPGRKKTKPKDETIDPPVGEYDKGGDLMPPGINVYVQTGDKPDQIINHYDLAKFLNGDDDEDDGRVGAIPG